MRTAIFFFLSMSLYSFCVAQHLELQTLSSFGVSQNNTNQTLGETIIFGNQTLTQGFHQGNLIVTSLNNQEDLIQIKVFPNPSINKLNIINPSDHPVDIRLFDARGNEQIYIQNMTGVSTQNIQSLPAGHYVLLITAKTTHIKSFLLQIIN